MRYKLVIFDFDGTLADSAPWMRLVINQVARRFRFRQVTDADFTVLRGCDNRAIVRYLGVPAWKMPFIANHMRRLAGRDADQIRLFDGVPALLRTLDAQGITLAIVSSNAEANVRRILGAENAALISHYACGASIFGKGAKFRGVLKCSGIPRHEVICIGDETRDIEAAAGEKLDTGAVTWGYAAAELLRAQRPTLVFDSVEAITTTLAA